MKRQEEREVKISSVNAELQEQQVFLLQEESKLKRCQESDVISDESCA